MRRVLFAALVVGLVIGADEKKDDSKKDLDRLKGKWTVASMELDGKAHEDAVGGKFSFDGDKMHLQIGDMEHSGTFKLDASKEPKQIDVTPADGPEKDQTLEGIYKLTDDELKICIAHASGTSRPKEFKSEEGSHILLFTLKREK